MSTTRSESTTSTEFTGVDGTTTPGRYGASTTINGDPAASVVTGSLSKSALRVSGSVMVSIEPGQLREIHQDLDYIGIVLTIGAGALITLIIGYLTTIGNRR